MAMVDIVIPEGDPQQGILEITVATSNAPTDMVSDNTGIEELVLPITGYGCG